MQSLCYPWDSREDPEVCIGWVKRYTYSPIKAIFSGNGDEYYYYYDADYYDDYYEDYSDAPDIKEKLEKPIKNIEFDESSVLENILEIISDKFPNRKPVNAKRQRYRPSKKKRFPNAWRRPLKDHVQENRLDFSTDNEESEDGNVGNILTSLGFFTVVLPSVLGGLLYIGVPVAQSLFAGASLITTFLLSGNNKSLITPVSIDSLVRGILISILEFIDSLTQGRVSFQLFT